MAGPMPTLKFLKGQSKNPIVPGICLIDDKFKFFYNKTISDGQTEPISLFYQCGMKKKSKCTASVILTKLEGKWWPQNLSPDETHNHASDRGAVLAQIMKKEMFAKVTEKPETKAEEAYRDVITDFEDRFGDEEHVWNEAIANLPNKDNLARHMRHIRSKEHGPLPKNRDEFDPETIVNSTVGGHKVVIMDSNRCLDREYYSQLTAFENNKSQFNEDLEPFILEANDIEEHDSSDMEMENDLNEAPINPFFAENSTANSTNSSDSSESPLKKKEINPFYAGESSSDSSKESSNAEEVLNDSIPNRKPKRIIAYSTKYLLKLFSQRKSSGDGTFKICPSLWKQLYIVMIKFGSAWIPVCYALLPDKCKETYFTLFYMLKKQMKDMNIQFNIESMRMDFEVGAMKAAAAAWKVVVKGCYYHFTQSGWRFVQSNNMASAYLADNDQEFKLLVKCVLSLPHVPVEDLENTLEILNDKEWDFGESEEKYAFKEKILQYVRDYWVDGQIPPQVWNCFHRKVDLTNNNNESHNNYLNNAINGAHPTPAKLTVALVKELTLAETTLRKVKSGSERIVKKDYQKLNKRRESLKKLYHKMDRVEYLSQIGNIVMSIQLNKGQMAELQKAKETVNDVSNDVEDENSAALSESLGEVDGSNKDSSNEQLIGSRDETHSSAEGAHPYEGRSIGKVAHSNGKKTKDYEVPEYKNKKCLSCKGKFNIRSKYQVCKLCDQVIHVNNNKKCLKMKRFIKDKEFVCFKCTNDVPNNDEGSESEEPSTETTEEHLQADRTFTVNSNGSHRNNGSNYLADLTMDGFLCDGLIIEELRAPNNEEDDDGGSDSVDIETSSNSSVCPDESSEMHEQFPQVPCHVCGDKFMTEDEMLKHIDVMHFYPCPICESVFLRSFEKKDHITNNHKQTRNDVASDSGNDGLRDDTEVLKENDSDEQEFQTSIMRHSTLLSERTSNRVVLEFVGKVPCEMKDLKRRRRMGAN